MKRTASFKFLVYVLCCLVLSLVIILGFSGQKTEAARLSDPSLVGSVIKIPLTDNSGGEYYRFLVTNQKSDSGAIYLMGMDNACQWGDVECVSDVGTPWNDDTAVSVNGSNDLNSVAESNKVTTQLVNFYNLLPSSSVDIRSNVQDHQYDLWAIYSREGTSSRQPCRSTAGNDSIGNNFVNDGIASTAGGKCYYTSKISLVSYEEWQGGLIFHDTEPIAGSVGNLFCYALMGTQTCKTGPVSEIARLFNWPLTRTPASPYSDRIWLLYGTENWSIYHYNANNAYGLLPTLYLSADSFATLGGEGTYANPYGVANFCDVPENQNTLACLDFGSVIQLTPKDQNQGMCPGTITDSCETVDLSATVLPYKFVKMQARKTDVVGTPISNPDSTYWMFLDNYCWWGSARCLHGDIVMSGGSAWNGVSGTTEVERSNNITNTKFSNFLKPLANFYNDLPDQIGNLEKEVAIPEFAWDMNGNSMTAGEVGWYDGANRPWNTTPNSNVPTGFSFSGDYSAPVMTSRVNLISYNEWQGGNIAYNVYPTAPGSGYSFCQARFGVDCTNNGQYELFNNLFASSSNPTPRVLARSPFTGSLISVTGVSGGSAAYSMHFPNAGTAGGISPTLWLSSNLKIAGARMGTYESPYCLEGDQNCLNSSDQNIKITVEVESGIGLDCDDTIDLGTIYLYGVNRESFNCHVLSNNPTGYEINFQSASTLVNTDTSSTDSISPLAIPGQLSSSNTANWAVNSSPTASQTDDNWRTTGTLIQTSSPSLPTGDPYTFQAGVSIGQQVILNPGTYVGSFTLTATTI